MGQDKKLAFQELPLPRIVARFNTVVLNTENVLKYSL